MSGTEWTEPGKGATADDLNQALRNISRPSVIRGGNPEAARNRLRELALANVSVGDEPIQIQLRNGGTRIVATPQNWTYRTNLRLTGEPLTAEDLARIAEAR
jgi:hypothetical protein